MIVVDAADYKSAVLIAHFPFDEITFAANKRTPRLYSLI